MIFLGTRASPLALIQAKRVEDALKNVQPDKQVEIVPMNTQGDQISIPLADFGGKYLFTKELQEALMNDSIHGAVHSLKDVEEHSFGLVFGAFLERQNPFDVMIVHKDFQRPNARSKFTIGTCAPRRKQQIRKVYPNAIIQDIRGNVGTRLNKVNTQVVDAIILAKAGLNRLDIRIESDLMNLFPDLRMQELPINIMIPAAGQGIIAVECKRQNIDLFSCINDKVIEKIALTERMFIKAFNGNCRTALAAYVHAQDVNSQDFRIDGFYLNQWKSMDLKDFLHSELKEIQEIVNKFVSTFD